MSGTIRAKLDGYIAGGSATNNIIGAFKFLWDHLKELESLGVVTEIARNNGNTKGGGDTGWWDEANSFGENAWSVFRWNTNLPNRSWEWYLLIQAAVNANNNVGNPGLLENSTTADGIGMAMAISVNTGSGVTSNPWAGATGSMGTDTKGDPVWTTGSVGDALFVIPRSNSLSGSHTSSRQNLLRSKDNDSGNYRIHFYTDDDGFVALFGDPHADADYSQFWATMAMPYTPSAIVSSSVNTPFIAINSDNDTDGPFERDVALASTAGTAGRNGGIIAADMICTRIPRVDFIHQERSATWTDSPDYSGEDLWNHIPGIEEGTRYPLLDLALFVNSNESSYQGYVGLLNSNLIKAVRFSHIAFQSPENDKIIFANTRGFNPGQYRTVYAVPWTGSVTFGTNYVRREGIFSGSLG
jgi:hypothetical protein